MQLAPYAVTHENYQGREFLEPAPTDRSQFQRDRDRIIHSAAFRRLEYKTQVFINHEGDMYRTRLTHSIEVAQIARSIARNLKLNEDLTEAIALSHDLGHTPFGHAGQTALNQCMQGYGGFEHNLQSIRVVDLLEQRYQAFSGLNLCFETREGILKHCSLANAKKLGTLGERFINKTQPSLEAQLVDIADAVAYNNHDVDDGLRSGLLSTEYLIKSELFANAYNHMKNRYPDILDKILHQETVRLMIHRQISDLIKQSKNNIDKAMLKTIGDVRQQNAYLISFSDKMTEQHLELKNILRKQLYQHQVVAKMSLQAHKIIEFLFNHFMQRPQQLPAKYKKHKMDEQQTARICSDYIAGMTDRFALKLSAQIKHNNF